MQTDQLGISLPKLPNPADIGTKFKDEIMSGARKVAFTALVIGGLVILGPRIPGMVAKFADGTGKFIKTTAKFGGEAYTAGKKAGQAKVASGIDEVLL